jgi:hypothetical protein
MTVAGGGGGLMFDLIPDLVVMLANELFSARMRHSFGSPKSKKHTMLPKHQDPEHHLRNLKRSLERQTTSGLLQLAL